MSRYSKTYKTEERDIIIYWGFDHVLGYFYDLVDPAISEEDGDEGWFESKSTLEDPKFTRGEFLEFLIRYDLPEEHRKMVALDLPF